MTKRDDKESERLIRLIDELRSLQNMDRTAGELVAAGQAAVEPLRCLLFERSPSGVFEPRRLAAQSLAALGARDVLIDFLSHPREIIDPVEKLGEEAVISAAARELAESDDSEVFDLMVRLATHEPPAGVIEALGAFQRPETIPLLVQALREDFTRISAANALKKFDDAAVPALMEVAMGSRGNEPESESTLRQRRAALDILEAIGPSAENAHDLRYLLHADDALIAIAACSICLTVCDAEERKSAAKKLIELSSSSVPIIREKVEECLVEHFETVRDRIDESIREFGNVSEDIGAARTRRVLMRARVRGIKLL